METRSYYAQWIDDTPQGIHRCTHEHLSPTAAVACEDIPVACRAGASPRAYEPIRCPTCDRDPEPQPGVRHVEIGGAWCDHGDTHRLLIAGSADPHVRDAEIASHGVEGPYLEHVIVVRPSEGGRFVAATGIGGHTRGVRGSFATPEGALEAGRRDLHARNAAIGREYERILGPACPGLPQVPELVLWLGHGENAWDAYTAVRRPGVE